jgi:hypothetical protein
MIGSSKKAAQRCGRFVEAGSRSSVPQVLSFYQNTKHGSGDKRYFLSPSPNATLPPSLLLPEKHRVCFCYEHESGFFPAIHYAAAGENC